MCTALDISCIDFSKWTTWIWSMQLLTVFRQDKSNIDLISRFIHSVRLPFAILYDCTTWMRLWRVLHFIPFKSIPCVKHPKQQFLHGLRTLFQLLFDVRFAFHLVCLLSDDFFRFNFAVVCFDCIFDRSPVRLNVAAVRARMFIALIYSKRMEQTEYLIRTI